MRGHIRQRGKTRDSWELIYDVPTIDGDRKQRSVAFRGTKKQAEVELRRRLSEVDAGNYIEPSKILTSVYLERWIRDYVEAGSVAEKTRDWYRYITRSHLIPGLGHLQLRDIRPAHIVDFYRGLREASNPRTKAPYSPRTLLHVHRVLHKTLATAVRWQLLIRNPVELVDAPQPPRVERPVLTEHQARELLVKLDGTLAQPIVRLALETGMRVEEMLGLRWLDVDLDAGIIRVAQVRQSVRGAHVHIREPKTQRARRILSISESLAGVLRHHRVWWTEERLKAGPDWPTHDLLFVDELGRPLTYRRLRLEFVEARDRAGLPPVHLHDLRHTSASWALKRGAPIHDVSARLGHASHGFTLDTYVHSMPGGDKAIANSLGGVFEDDQLKEVQGEA